MIFLLVTQKQFKTLGHIMGEIATMSKHDWPDKFIKFELAFLNFLKQRDETKTHVGAILDSNTLKGFLSTLAGYMELLEVEIKACNKFWPRVYAKRSRKLLESLRTEISTQLSAQKINVN